MSCQRPPTTSTTSRRPPGPMPASELHAGHHAAVDEEVDAGAEGRRRAREEDDRVRDLGGAPVPTHRDAGANVLVQRRSSLTHAIPVATGEVDRPGRDGVDA